MRASTQKQLQAIIEEKGLASSSMFVIEALLKLRQACCHTSLIKGKIAYDPYSAKMEFLENNLKEMIAQDGKIIIFSQFTSMLDLIEPLLETMNIPFIRLDGKTRNRTEKVNMFQEGDIPVFLISLKAGGVGLNITKANIVIHMDLWWNPAVEDQATDRAHRIGQTQTVMVYRLVMKDSVEEKIIALQEKKRDIASIVDMEDGQLIEGVTVNDLYDLLA